MIFLCVAFVFIAAAGFCFAMAARELDGAVDAVREGDWWH